MSINNSSMKLTDSIFDHYTIIVGRAFLELAKNAFKNKEYISCYNALNYCEQTVDVHQRLANRVIESSGEKV